MNRNRKKVVAASVAVGMTMVMGFSPVLAANTDISKEETVYVNAASDGTPQEITVSDWLKNSASAGDLSDVSDLKDIKNVKGDETFSQNGDKLTWNTDDKSWKQNNRSVCAVCNGNSDDPSYRQFYKCNDR